MLVDKLKKHASDYWMSYSGYAVAGATEIFANLDSLEKLVVAVGVIVINAKDKIVKEVKEYGG